ncbi:hypothetical protein O181_049057 [Austropuccinia psidii MF-1]|uniref:ATP-dependent DNA helicase II subunit 1 n=1 Tax=Austropuccinia psidii MF-1 TaxID=1389203 RepID=A0A9Q3E126_9BASI|nr:hypothetical protein [Austropuccinia psidii MF-1]
MEPFGWPSTYGASTDQDQEDNEEFQDQFSVRKDVILFAIEATDAMISGRPQIRGDLDPDKAHDIGSCGLLDTVQMVYQLMRKKIISSPKDRIGLMVFNVQQSGSKTGTHSWSSCVFLHDLTPIDAPSIQKLKMLIEKCHKDPQELPRLFVPQSKQPNQIHEALRSALNRFKECAPTHSSKRLFLITSNINPLSSADKEQAQRVKVSMTASKDLAENGIALELFCTQQADFSQINQFYGPLLEYHIDPNYKDTAMHIPPFVHLPLNSDMQSWFDKLLRDASMREMNKRSAFSIPFRIGEGFEIGISGYVLIAEEKRKGYIWVDPYTSTSEEVKIISEYRDAESTAVVPRHQAVNYFPIGDSKDVRSFRRIVFSPQELEEIRTLGLDKGLRLLGFRPRDEVRWQDHLKHSYFIYPSDDLLLGSTRAFSALLQSMVSKQKIGYGLLRARKGDTPALVAILPQLEIFDPNMTQERPSGMHLCILPWADELYPPPTVDQLSCLRDSEEQICYPIKLADKIVKKLKVAYAPNNIRNPALQYHYDFLAAKYLREPFEESPDQSLPWYSAIKERCGCLISQLKEAIDDDPRAQEESTQPIPMAKKRRRIEDGEGVDTEVVEAAFANGRESSLLVQQLKEYLIFKGKLKVGSKPPLKAGLIDAVRMLLREDNTADFPRKGKTWEL